MRDRRRGPLGRVISARNFLPKNGNYARVLPRRGGRANDRADYISVRDGRPASARSTNVGQSNLRFVTETQRRPAERTDSYESLTRRSPAARETENRRRISIARGRHAHTRYARLNAIHRTCRNSNDNIRARRICYLSANFITYTVRRNTKTNLNALIDRGVRFSFSEITHFSFECMFIKKKKKLPSTRVL